MLKSVMNVLMVPVLGFALLIAVGQADVIPEDPPVAPICYFQAQGQVGCVHEAPFCPPGIPSCWYVNWIPPNPPTSCSCQ